MSVTARLAKAGLGIAGAGAPGSPQRRSTSSVALAAGGIIDLDSDQITAGTTGKLRQVTIAATVPLKAEIKARDGAGETLIDTVFTSETELTLPWIAPHEDWAQQVGGALRNFRATITNQDTIDAADVYATFYWDEV